jgi:hypothetical protein
MTTQFKYIKSDNTEGMVSATSADEAIKLAPDRMSSSGVQAMPVDTNKPMTTQEMAGSGTLSPKVTNTPPASQNLGGAVDSTAAGIGADLAVKQETTPEAKVRESMDAYLGTEGKEEITAAKEQEIVKKQAALKIQNELTKMDKDYRDEVARIKENPRGQTEFSLNAEINKATDRYNNNRANVSIAYNTALGDYQAAQETVNLKTQSYNDLKKNQYAEWEMNYKMATDFATPEQKLLLEQKSAQMKADISLMTDAKKTVMDNLLQNNAPQSVWNAVDAAASKEGATPADIMAAAGSYGVDKYRQAQTAKLLEDTKAANNVGLAPTPGVDSSYYNAFNNVVIGLSDGRRKVATETFDAYLRSGDIQSAKNYIVRLATVNMPVEQQSQAIGRAQATDALKDIKSLVEQAQEAGAGTNLISGSLENVSNKLGVSSNPNLSLIGNQIQQALQTYRKGMTGVAFSPAEAKEYAKIFPDTTNVSSLNTLKVDSLLQSFDRNNRAALEFYIGAGNYESLFGEKKGMVLPGGSSNLPQGDDDYEAEYNQLYGPKEVAPTAPKQPKQEPDYINRFEELTKPPTYDFKSWFKL